VAFTAIDLRMLHPRLSQKRWRSQGMLV